MPGIKKTNQFNQANSGLLSTIAPGFNYLAVEIPGDPVKFLTALYVGYIPATGGTVVTTNLRIGRVMVIAGTAMPTDTSIQLDPFSPQFNPTVQGRVLVDEVVRNTFQLEPALPIRFESGETCTVIIGLSVGEADTASAPSASVGYLTVLGFERFAGDKPFPFDLR